ncbi:MAG TPA: hypothetical protein VNP72_05175, partial [Longimicrobium sp.]|nr:hypothetical protein [Longimicrobium sp.]
QVRSGYTFIQDASAGIRIFSSTLEGQGIAVGDRIEVSGTVALFNQDYQIATPTLRARDPAFGSVAPVSLTTAAAGAAGAGDDPLMGSLVRLTKAQVIGYGTGSNARNATVNDGTGATQVRIESAVGATEPAAQALMGVGKCYNVTGPLGTFNGTAQVFPRTVADIVEVPCT